jgi:hypothetical protein
MHLIVRILRLCLGRLFYQGKCQSTCQLVPWRLRWYVVIYRDLPKAVVFTVEAVFLLNSTRSISVRCLTDRNFGC